MSDNWLVAFVLVGVIGLGVLLGLGMIWYIKRGEEREKREYYRDIYRDL